METTHMFKLMHVFKYSVELGTIFIALPRAVKYMLGQLNCMMLCANYCFDNNDLAGLQKSLNL